ncbi:hypothetical protein [Niabella aurantiaca]|uniref:hypothetical protein n=1 Tax=Niabella aurantiaca TaxID=379900 RepID=UPI000476E48D|nr:hypothetical protein [Niabella aurantiaca]
MIWFYGVGVPLCLLVFDTVIDLNDGAIFGIWMIISIIMYIVSLTTYSNDAFVMHRTGFDTGSPVNSLIAGYSTSSLKTLLIFLIVYWLFNKLLNKKGLFVINTFRQTGWYHDTVQRRITGFDVLTNVVLCVAIIAAALFGH